MIFTYVIAGRKEKIASQFQKSVSASLNDHPDQAQALFDAYEIHEDTSDDQALRHILEFATDIGFYASALTIARAWPDHAYVYHFNVPNPWHGPFRGDSTHILDVAFLFQNFNDHIDQELTAVAEKFGLDFICFVNEKDSYPAHGKERRGVQIYGPPAMNDCAFISEPTQQTTGRRQTIWKLAEKTGLDKLSAAWDKFMAGH
ncbi:hypothetical protein H2198_009207 [Neophaeococcomyces mojaviensis]|uniref:Uncharacterized protein n=1 Tax=Neophaeococcomyces mojaviensis TaxID=3383035 RepID=A0ACC2ZV92_9EURO|nr:hypothetical protein H2198_009207 [Knufia sp. JES_112]